MFVYLISKYKNPLIFIILAIFCVAFTILVGENVSRAFSEKLKVLLIVGALCLVVGWGSIPKRTAVILLSVLVFVSGANYMRWGPDVLTKRIDGYDVIHYYMGAKYFDEIGYYDLYPAIALVDYEAGPYNPKLDYYRFQSPDKGYEVRPISEAIRSGRKIQKSKFTPERWELFEHDFLTLQRDFQLSKKQWGILLLDRGFNGTPAWVAGYSAAADLVPVEYIKWLCAADIIFLAIGLLAIQWAYGNVAALWGLAFLFLSYSVRWPVISWAFARYDWVCFLLIALALIKKKFHFEAGIMTAFASAFRLFPVLWLFGPAAKGLLNLVNIKERSFRWNKRLLLLAGGFLLGVMLIEGGAVLRVGTAPFIAHTKNIVDHIKPEELSSKRLGFVIGMFYDGKLLPKMLTYERKQVIKKYKHIHLFVSFIILVVVAWSIRNSPDDQAFAYGYIPFFILMSASYYYAVARILLIVYHGAHMDRRRHRGALAILLTLELFSNWAETSFKEHRAFLIGYLAWGLTFYSIYIIWSLYKDDQEARLSNSLNAGASHG